jgi:hypothetical protein
MAATLVTAHGRTADRKTLDAASARRMRRGTGATRIRCFAVLILAVGLARCGIVVSSQPIYPNSWPAMATLDKGQTCPDISGTYLAVSNEAAPLVYPPGGHPREIFMFVPVGKPEPVPPLGRRILPWHLAGEFDRKSDLWNTLGRYATTVEADVAYSDQKADTGWVRVQKLPDGLVEIRTGFRDQTLLNLALKKEVQSRWTYKSHIYTCKHGGLVVVGGFSPPPVENPTGATHGVGARCTFFRAVDGSLVMPEKQYFGPPQGNMVFNKWWRWQPIE